MLRIFAFFSIVIWFVSGSARAEEARFALVVGNAQYQMGALRNPRNDARSMAEALVQSNFKTTLIEDITFAEFELAIDSFLAEVPEDAVAMFYYAGHGLQIDGRNYLLPVDVDTGSVESVINTSVSATKLVERFDKSGIGFSIFVLDACRDNPFAIASDEVGRGLASIESDSGETLIGFATQSGELAYDGGGYNSPYTGALVTEISKEGNDILDVFRNVRRSVRVWTQGQQRPFISASIERNFSFRPKGTVAAPKIELSNLTFDNVLEIVEKLWWGVIADSKNPNDFRSFVRFFPESSNVGEARNAAVALAKLDTGVDFRSLQLAQFTLSQEPTQTDPFAIKATPCDISAADPDDPRRIADGVPWGLVNVPRALRDCAEALAEDPQNPRLLHQMGRILDIQGRFTDAEQFYRLAGSLDYSASLVNLGYQFSASKGRERNFETAMDFYQLAAAQGNQRARTNIGIYYERGWLVEKDLGKAVQWYRLAALNGWPNALDALGNLYRKGLSDNGTGVERDLREAVRLYRVAAELGSTNAMNNLGRLFLSDENEGQDVEEGVYWLTRAVELGNKWAPYSLGRLYLDGNKIPKDEQAAVRLFERGADLGNIQARTWLGRVYEEGRGVPQDALEAGFHYALAARTADKRKPKEIEAAENRLADLGLSDDDLAAVSARADNWVRNNGR